MNTETIAAADFKRKPYAKPQIRVAEIGGADIICTSSKLSTQALEEEEFNWGS